MTSHSSQTHTLTFSQLVGTFTVDKELIGAQDPYVIFEAGGHKCQTKAIKSVGASTCEWKETYELKEFSAKGAVKEATSKASSHSHGSTVLEVTAYNHNTLRPDGTIGSGTVDLARLGSSQLSGSGDRVTVHLTDKKGKSVGELKFLIHGGGYQGASSGSAYGTSGVSQGSSATRGGDYDSTGRPITGVGAGPTHSVAHQAARKAAHEGHDVDIQTREGIATGHPTGAGYGSSQGVSDQSRTTGVHGHDHTSSGVSGVRGEQSRTTGVHGHDHTHTASGVRGVDVTPGEVIDRKYYVASEDRPQEQALVEQYREHNPYEKEYETSVQHTGRERQVGSSIEALGTQERVVDTRNHVHAIPHEQIARALPEGAIDQRPGGEGWVQGKPGPICDSTKFAITGDITVDKERVTNLREHREFEKEFEVKTALVGERALDSAGQVEQLKRERILLDEKKKVACENHPEVEAPRGTGVTSDTHTGHHSGGQTTAQGLTGNQGSYGTMGQGLTGTHGSHGHSGQGLTGTSGSHGHSGQGLTGNQGSLGTTGQGLTGTHGSHGTSSLTGTKGQTGQEKGMFQKVKDAVTGQ